MEASEVDSSASCSSFAAETGTVSVETDDSSGTHISSVETNNSPVSYSDNI